jgi:hypothetical protein
VVAYFDNQTPPRWLVYVDGGISGQDRLVVLRLADCDQLWNTETDQLGLIAERQDGRYLAVASLSHVAWTLTVLRTDSWLTQGSADITECAGAADLQWQTDRLEIGCGKMQSIPLN